MTNPLGDGLLSVLKKKTHFHTALWRIERTDGLILRFTDASSTVEFENETYVPTDGVNASARRKQEGTLPPNLEVVGIVSDSAITFDDLQAGFYENAVISEIIVDYRAPYLGALLRTDYVLIETKFNGEVWEAKVEGTTRKLVQPVGRVFGRTCDNDLGDSVCRVDVVASSENGTVSVIIGAGLDARAEFEATGLTAPDDDFTHGRLTWLTGDNAGLLSQVKLHTVTGVTTIELQLPTVFDIAVNDTFNVQQGCAKRFEEDCRDKFNNVVNFTGFPHMPNTDKTLQVPRPK